MRVLNERPPLTLRANRLRITRDALGRRLAEEEGLACRPTQAAVSIDNSRLFLSVIQKNTQLVETKEQLEHRVSDLKLLFDLESAMGRATTMEDLARAVITEAGRACEARAGGMLVDEIEGGLFLYFFDLTGFDGGSAPPRAPSSACASTRKRWSRATASSARTNGRTSRASRRASARPA